MIKVLFIGVFAICITIFYNYVSNPIDLIIWSFTGDGYLFEFCISFFHIFLYDLILQCWRIFRNHRIWSIILLIELPILILIIPICYADRDLSNYFTIVYDWNNYGMTPLAFALSSLEIGGIIIYFVANMVDRRIVQTDDDIRTSSLPTRILEFLTIFSFVGGILYFKFYDNGEDSNTRTLTTTNGSYYIYEHRSTDSIYVKISDNEFFSESLSFRASTVETFGPRIFVMLYPNNIVDIDYPDSFISIESMSKYNVLFMKEPDMNTILSDKELSYECYYFWFSFAKDPIVARHIVFSKSGDILKYRDISMKKLKPTITE